jgi:HD-GYP domain-containing protein (c-di-GMP phosphodiesterase class II)
MPVPDTPVATPEVDAEHFTRAITELGEKRPVVAKQAIFNAQGVKIVEKGTAINASLYERLNAHKLPAPLEEALSAEGVVTGRSLRLDTELMLEREPFYARMTTTPTERSKRLDVVEKLPLPDAMAFQLTLARDLRPSVYQHSLRAMWTMVWLANSPLGKRFELAEAAAVGLLHDIGMLHLDPMLLDPKAILSPAQRRQLYSHPIIGHMLMERHHEYPKEVLRAVLEHHECLNASGYPRNLGGAQISPLGRCMSLSEVVTAMVGSDANGGELRLAVLLRMNMHRYDPALIDRVMGLLRPELDAGSTAIVPLAEPAQTLIEIDEVVSAWPSDCAGFDELTPERQAGMAIVSDQIAQLRRTLAEAGLAPAQLEQLGDGAQDPMLARELSLLAKEAAWQLRTLARQASRRWRGGSDSDHPPLLQTWMDRCETLAQQLLGAAVVEQDD